METFSSQRIDDPRSPKSAAEATLGGSLVVAAPVFNEEALVAEFVDRIFALRASVNIRGLIIVDDGSTDSTFEVLRRAVTSHEDRVPVRVVHLTRNFGHQNAVMAALAAAHAWAERDEIHFIGLIDADLQDRPEHFADLMAATADADVVYAQRASRGEGVVFRALTGLFYWLMSHGTKHEIPMHAGNFSVMRREVVGTLLMNADRTPYFPGLRAWVGYRQRGVELDRDARLSGRSKVGFKGLFKLAFAAIFSYSNLPVQLMSLFASVVLLLSLVAGVTMTTLKMLGMVEVQGTALTIVSIFFSLGIQSVYLLVIAYMLTRIASESSRVRPYLVMREEEIE